MSGGPTWPSLRRLAEVAGADGGLLVVQSSLRRIREHDGDLRSFLAVQADESDLQVREDGPLSGVPLAVKDNIAVEGLPLTCGSRILEGYVPPFTATVVERLQAAGAVVVGKTNMDEFAMGSSSETSAYGQCRNPWMKDRVPGGSSGGSAAAVAAGLVPAALGSDTGGSVRQPAAFCGTVGFKPSYGALSRFGLVAYGSSLDQIGMLTGRVADAEHLFRLMLGHDRRDGTVVAVDELDRSDPVSGQPTVGFFPDHRDHPALDEATRVALEQVLDIYRSQGHDVRELSLPHADEIVVPAYYLTACAEASSNLARFDGVRYGPRADREPDRVEDLIRSTRALFGREVQLRILLGTYVLRAGHYDQYYGRAQQARSEIAMSYRSLFDEVDILVTPSAPTQAFRIGELIDDPVTMKLADQFTVTANLAGLPAISLPVGVSGGLPTAVQLMGKRSSDLLLLNEALRLENWLEFDPAKCPFLRGLPSLKFPGGDVE